MRQKSSNAAKLRKVPEIEYVFVGAGVLSEILIFDCTNGQYVFTLKAGPEVGNASGWFDIPNPVQAYRRNNNEYLVFVEENARHKIMMYRWQPSAFMRAEE